MQSGVVLLPGLPEAGLEDTQGSVQTRAQGIVVAYYGTEYVWEHEEL